MFLLLVFGCSVPARMNDTFLGEYIRELGGNSELVGLAFFIAAASEIVVFALSFWWLRTGKELAIISISAAFYFIRFFASAWISDPQLLVYLQVLQLLTFPIFYSAAIQYLYRIVPEEWRATNRRCWLCYFSAFRVLWPLMQATRCTKPLAGKRCICP
ncbi:UNVERIFIED_CONTAM: Zn-dependent protease with chaperone function [Paenibacillus sp. PvR008]